MKNLLLILPLLIVGCASFAPSTKVIEVSHDMEVTSRDASTNETHIWQTKIVKNYEDLTVEQIADGPVEYSLWNGRNC